MSVEHSSEKQPNFFRRHRWLSGFAIALILVLLSIFFLLPPAIQWGLEKWLESHGQLKAEVQDVDFNLFTGNLEVHSLVTQRKGAGGLQALQVAVELAFFPVFKKRLLLDKVSLTDVTVDVVRENSGDVYVGGLRIAGGEEELKAAGERKNGWEIGFGGIDLQNVTIIYSAPGYSRRLIVTKGHIDPLQSWNPSSAGDFSMSLTIDDGRANFKGSVKPYAPETELKVDIDMQNISLAWFRPWMTAEGLDIDQGTLGAKASLAVSAKDKIKSDLDGTVTLSRVRGSLPQTEVGPLTLIWNGSLKLVLGGESSGSPRLHAQGALTAEEPKILLTSRNVEADADSLRIEGELSSDSQKGSSTAGFSFNGQMNLDAIEVKQAGQDMALARVDRVGVEQLRIEGLDRISAERARVSGTKLFQQAAPGGDAAQEGLVLGELNIKDFQIDAQEQVVKASSVRLLNLDGRLVRNEKGEVETIARWPDAAPANETTPSAQPAGKSSWRYVVDKAQIGGDSAFAFRDESIEPPVDLRIANIDVDVQKLDSRTTERSPISLKTDLGPHGRLEAQGGITPLTEAIDLDVTGEVKQFSLPEIRGYAQEKLGYTIRSGQLYADFHLEVKNSQSDSLVKLFISDLTMRRVSEDELEELRAQLGMPLNTALDLLRDGDGNIRLALPITGQVDRPNVDFGSVIAKTLKNTTFEAIKTAVLVYFAPLGAAYAAPLGAAYLAGKLIGKAMAVRFSPINFEAGQAKLDADARKYLEQVAEKISARPEVHLFLCGKAVPADRRALVRGAGEKEEPAAGGQDISSGEIADAKLLSLAEKRAEAARSFLVSKGIASKRLVVCAPEIDHKDDARPQVELGTG